MIGWGRLVVRESYMGVSGGSSSGGAGSLGQTGLALANRANGDFAGDAPYAADVVPRLEGDDVPEACAVLGSVSDDLEGCEA